MKRATPKPATTKRASAKRKATPRKIPASPVAGSASVVEQLQQMEASKGDGTLDLGGGARLNVSSLGKTFFPRDRITKGDVMRYYARVAEAILPVMRDRPLVLKRYPDGIDGQSFYQQKAPDRVPPHVRAETIHNEQGEAQRRLIGGDLATLLYIVQLGAVSVDPWHSRVPRLELADFTILDLDPGPKAPFSRVVEVAKLIEEELDALDLVAIPKTSGASGMHIVVPLRPGVPDEAAVLAAQIIATRVAARAPTIATIERTVSARASGAVYVDYLQNIRAKTVAAAYSVRAKPGATVSTPLEWKEIDKSLDPRDFTITTVPNRLRKRGDLWERVMRKGNSIRAVLDTQTGRSRPRR
jgi:bifunctional non-homologous end joining protein LigD